MTREMILSGHRTVTVILGLILLIHVLTIISSLLQGNFGLPQLIRVGLTFWLAWSVYRGSAVARWIMVVLLVFAAITTFNGGMHLTELSARVSETLQNPGALKGVIFMAYGMATAYGLSAIALAFMPNVKAYFAYVQGQAS
ncbi:hypothetical protein [Deinococcus cellulosilyticus]|uniref:Uncharacterized protein n=1 Tax=Deinococcus cellulosilyticus (strain DSM 18568 / NBRC 106333 / KACC 11606 / 5516J-15) TaxID=1223518 RepID=A0A511N475_DEIC1|nr:hypothetical protein [Deinococcus cellulosilyticus]GEM47674.1 hypothetical protein DC3_33090 [Deinococcus cellulosilyticus NBRC 106333 = KACC 11606]